MNKERLLQIIDSFGAAPDRWPAAERDPAVSLLDTLAADRDVSAALAAARALDASLAMLEVPAASPQLLQAVLARTQGASQDPGGGGNSWLQHALEWLTGWHGSGQMVLWRPAVAALLPLAIGFAIGLDAGALNELAVDPDDTTAGYVSLYGLDDTFAEEDVLNAIDLQPAPAASTPEGAPPGVGADHDEGSVQP